jgi:hypothetical protein
VRSAKKVLIELSEFGEGSTGVSPAMHIDARSKKTAKLEMTLSFNGLRRRFEFDWRELSLPQCRDAMPR